MQYSFDWLWQSINRNQQPTRFWPYGESGPSVSPVHTNKVIETVDGDCGMVDLEQPKEKGDTSRNRGMLQPLHMLSWVTDSTKVRSGSTPTLEPHAITVVNLQAINTSWTIVLPYAGPLLRLWPWLSIDLQNRVATWKAQCQVKVSCFNVSYVIITWVLW